MPGITEDDLLNMELVDGGRGDETVLIQGSGKRGESKMAGGETKRTVNYVGGK